MTLAVKLVTKRRLNYGVCAFFNYQVPQKRNSSNWQDVYANFSKAVSESDAVAFTVDSLAFVHNLTGFSWASTILGASIGLRCLLTLPAAIHQHHVLARLELCKYEYAKILEDLKIETAYAIKKFNWNDKQARLAYNISAKKQWKILIERDNCHPFKATLVFWIQLPVWIILSISIRAMSFGVGQNALQMSVVRNELLTEQYLWLPSLALSDPTWIFPVLVAAINLLIIEIQACQKPNASKLQNGLTHVLRGLALLSFPIAINVPSCLCLYWVSSSGLALGQTLFLMSPRARKFLGIPKTPSHVDQPYSKSWETFKLKFVNILK